MLLRILFLTCAVIIIEASNVCIKEMYKLFHFLKPNLSFRTQNLHLLRAHQILFTTIFSIAVVRNRHVWILQ